VGKTTLVQQLINQTSTTCHLVSADDIHAGDRAWLRLQWTSARQKVEQGTKEVWLIVDEVQKIENWSETVKKEWDYDTTHAINLKVILLGSSRLLIQRGLTESLAGRFETIYIPHWSFAEMRDAFGWTVEQYIYFGGFPGAATLIDEEIRWKKYIRESLVETSISKDVLMMAVVEKPTLLRRLFEIGTTYSGQILSLNKIQGELQETGNLTTLSNYLRLLESAGLLGGIEKYAGSVIRKRASKPKFQVFNNALLSTYFEADFKTAMSHTKDWGRFVESAVGAHLLNGKYEQGYNLYYWNENNNEVDFVIEKNGKIIALEVKSGVSSANKGLSVFAQKFNPEKILLVGTDGIPLDEFLMLKPEKLFL
jgi:predicted AAA+ superfamily ATPase